MPTFQHPGQSTGRETVGSMGNSVNNPGGRAATPEERAKWLALMQIEHQVGGAQDVMPQLSLAGKAAMMLGPTGSAITTMSGQQFPTEGISNRGGDTTNLGSDALADIILARPVNKLPRTLRELFASVPEGEMYEHITSGKGGWRVLDSGVYRRAFQNRGVVAKVPRGPSVHLNPILGGVDEGSQQNLDEFLNMVNYRDLGQRGRNVRVVEPYAFSPKDEVSFSRLTKRDTNLSRDLRINQNDDVHDFGFDQGIFDMHKNNWIPSVSKPASPFTVIHDIGGKYEPPMLPDVVARELAISNRPLLRSALRDRDRSQLGNSSGMGSGSTPKSSPARESVYRLLKGSSGSTPRR